MRTNLKPPPPPGGSLRRACCAGGLTYYSLPNDFAAPVTVVAAAILSRASNHDVGAARPRQPRIITNQRQAERQRFGSHPRGTSVSRAPLSVTSLVSVTLRSTMSIGLRFFFVRLTLSVIGRSERIVY